MPFTEEEIKEAIEDFLKEKGEGKPSPKTCEILMKHHVVIRDIIRKSLDKNLKNISIMPYGDEIFFAEEPVFFTVNTTRMFIGPEEKRMYVYFDRN